MDDVVPEPVPVLFVEPVALVAAVELPVVACDDVTVPAPVVPAPPVFSPGGSGTGLKTQLTTAVAPRSRVRGGFAWPWSEDQGR